MKISKKLNDAINTQIGEELKASNGYANMAAYFNKQGLVRLTEMFFEQSEEEREHAMKFVHYLLEVDGDLAIPAIPEVSYQFKSVKEAFETALSWEKAVTQMINNLVDLAVEEKDYATQNFLAWYVDEQVEEEATMSQLVLLAEELKDRSPLMIERYLPQE
ncbi:MAG: ferritin [Chloroflexota bacterium]|nr:ferritin [Chloroflexota bacterium]